MIKELQYVSHLDLNLGSLGHSHQWRRLQYNSSICLPLVMGLNQLPQREFPSLAPAAWRPGSQVCGCSALRFTADCNGLSVIRIRFKWRLKFGSSSHPFVGVIRYLEPCSHVVIYQVYQLRFVESPICTSWRCSWRACRKVAEAAVTRSSQLALSTRFSATTRPTTLIRSKCHNVAKFIALTQNSAANGELLNLVLPGDWGDWRVKTHVPRLEVFQRISRGGRMSCWRDVMRKSWDVVRSPVEGCCTLCLSKLRYPIRTFIRTWLQYIEHDKVWK